MGGRVGLRFSRWSGSIGWLIQIQRSIKYSIFIIHHFQQHPAAQTKIFFYQRKKKKTTFLIYVCPWHAAKQPQFSNTPEFLFFFLKIVTKRHLFRYYRFLCNIQRTKKNYHSGKSSEKSIEWIFHLLRGIWINNL